jgi:hypothetical protein
VAVVVSLLLEYQLLEYVQTLKFVIVAKVEFVQVVKDP